MSSAPESDEHDPALPGVITSITPQKRRKDRYSVFVDDSFLIGIAEDTLIEHNLATGDTITTAFFRKLQRDEGRNKVKAYLLKLLSRRDHAPRELQNKARRKDFAPDVVNSVIDELERKEFINKTAFAEKYARDKSNLNQWGPTKITAKLRQKGISKSTGAKAVEQAFSAVDIAKRLRELVEKRKRHFLREEDSFKRKKKVFDYLHRKGYRARSIYATLDDLMEMLDQ